MHVTFSSDGGFAAFPGLSRPFELDTAELPPAAAARLEGLVVAAAAAPVPAASPGAADHRTYHVTTDSHSLRFVEPVADGAARELIGWLEELRRTRS
ncbi:MAG TPA: protealysin inhibitor emfourin [Amycolatopsis sp.]|jgi:hypothetical protein